MPEAAKKQEAVFLTKKRKIIIILMLLLFIACLVITFVKILNINWVYLWQELSEGLKTNKGIFAFIIFLAAEALAIILNSLAVYLRIKKIIPEVTFGSCVEYTLSCTFLNLVGSMAVLSGAYSLYWMKKKKISNLHTSALVLYTQIFNELSQIILFIPSFIWLCIKYQLIVANVEGTVVFWLTTAGLVVNIFALLIFSIIGYSRRISYHLAWFINWIKYKIKLSYHTKEETYKKYFLNIELRKTLWDYTFSKYSIIYLFITLLAAALFSSIFFILYAFLREWDINYFWTFFAIQNCSNAANRFSILPGGIGTTEFINSTFLINLTNSLGSQDAIKNTINNAVLMNRVIGIIIALFGLCTFVFAIKKSMIKPKNQIVEV